MAFFQSAKTPLQPVYMAILHIRSHKVWATKRGPKEPNHLALDYFDNVYGTLYGKLWPSIRLALLCPNKYCAVINNYADTEAITTKLQNSGAMNIREMIDVQRRSLLDQNKSKNKKKKKEKPGEMLHKIEKITAEKRSEELNILYPSGTDGFQDDLFNNKNSQEEEVKQSKEELIKLAKTPLEQELLDADIDWDRQIDPIHGLSSTRLNEFVPVTQLKGKEGFVSEAEHFSCYNEPGDFPVTVQEEESLNFPPQLQIYTFDPGNISRFLPGKSGTNGLTNYYLLDGGSILPVLVLDLRPTDTVLDMCAAPGGKSYICLQTLYPESVVCNDQSISRLNRLRTVMDQYIENWTDKVTIRTGPGEEMEGTNLFSKILVDVPCTNDRLSVHEKENNIFTPSRNKERILLPSQQMNLLFKALKLVKVGGSVVYSTCSLNPAQNDGVVHMALKRVWEETSIKIVVKDLNNVLEPAKIIFRFAQPGLLRYGSLVLPYLPSNFGPMYFCKLQRVE